LNNLDSTSLKLSTGAIFFTDILSFSIMLVGLLRMRRETTDASSLGRFLWKQVRWFRFSPAVILPHLLMRISTRQGLFWIMIAALTEVPTVVRLAFHLDCPILLITLQVFMILDLNGSFSFPRIPRGQMLIELYSHKTASAPQPCTFLFAASGEGVMLSISHAVLQHRCSRIPV
jgi:hypothetical protein